MESPEEWQTGKDTEAAAKAVKSAMKAAKGP